jgi:hypothetical protein
MLLSLLLLLLLLRQNYELLGATCHLDPAFRSMAIDADRPIAIHLFHNSCKLFCPVAILHSHPLQSF